MPTAMSSKTVITVMTTHNEKLSQQKKRTTRPTCFVCARRDVASRTSIFRRVTGVEAYVGPCATSSLGTRCADRIIRLREDGGEARLVILDTRVYFLTGDAPFF